MTDRAWRLLTLGIVAALCAPALDFGFVSDDQHVIVQGKLVGSLANLPRLWTHDTMFNTDLGEFSRTSRLDTYRPLTMTTFALDHALWGKRALGYHLSSLLLHLLAAALVMRFSEQMLGSCRRACAVALAFGVHPLLTEAYVWINGRSDALACVLALGSLLALERADGRARYAGLAGLLLFLACLSKETALVLTVPLLLRPATLSLRGRAVCLSLLAAAAAYLCVRTVVLRGVRVGSGADLIDALGYVPWILAEGVAELLLPRQTTVRFLMEDVRLATGLSWAAHVAVLLGAAALLWRLRHRRLLLFGAAAFILLLAPVALVVPMRWIGFGRYLYLPAALLLPGLVDAIAALRRRRIVMAVWLGALAFVHITSLPDWRDNEHVLHAAIRAQPDRSHGFGALGAMRVASGDLDQGLPLLETANRKGLPNPRWIAALADAYMRAGRPKDAIAVAQDGLRRFPHDRGLHEFFRRIQPSP